MTTPRMNIMEAAPTLVSAQVRLSQRNELDRTIKHLVTIRASQINGCAFCLDMHWAEAVEDGVSAFRLQQLAAWQDSPAYDDRERAALALTEAMTVGCFVADDVWADAEREVGDALASLLFAIATINSWNRLQIATRALPASAATLA